MVETNLPFSILVPRFPLEAQPSYLTSTLAVEADGSTSARVDLVSVQASLVLPRAVKTTVEVDIKYDGYIKKQRAEIARMEKLEGKKLPDGIDYLNLKGLRIEAAQKLDKLRPLTVGQASRISGVNPADISVLLIYLGLK